MIIWIASYPKSGNTWLRALLSSYFFSKNGEFNFKLLENIKSFPSPYFFEKYSDPFTEPESTSRYWIETQEKINIKKNISLLKTHNAMCKINGNSFTNSKNSLGAIYIVRDPRNLVTSLSHHYQIKLEDALEFMVTKNKAIIHKVDNRFLGFNPLFSWQFHEESWSNCKKFPVLVIRYEDLEQKTFATFSKVINFILSISSMPGEFSRVKAIKSIQSCQFEKLQRMEKIEGFKEAVENEKTKKKLKFFNLGNKNNFRNLLSQSLIEKINKIFNKELRKYKYI